MKVKKIINKFFSHMHRHGFTLIELLIVVSILSFLLIGSFYAYGIVMKNSRDIKRRVDLAEIATAVEKFKKENDRYPMNFNELRLPQPYLQHIPEDPLAQGEYMYTYKSINKDQYILSARLELKDAYFIITPQGNTTSDTLITITITPTPSVGELYPTYPPNAPTDSPTPMPSIITPTWYYNNP